MKGKKKKKKQWKDTTAEKTTYSMGTLAAALQPHPCVVCYCARRKLDLVVTADGNLARALLSVHVPPRNALAKLETAWRGLGKQIPGVLQHANVGITLITGGSDDKISFNHLLISGVDEAIEATLVHILNLETHDFTVRLHAGDLLTTHDAMWPLRLISTKFSPLVVHPLVECFNELKPDHAVIGSAGFGEQVVAILGRLWEHGVNEVWIEDAIDTGSVSLILGSTTS